MKKLLSLVFSLLLVLVLVGCQEPPKSKHVVDFIDRNLNILASLEVEEGGSVTAFPEVQVEEGYYYQWNLTLEELTNIMSDMTVEGVKKEYYKNVKYFIDDELFYEFTGVYTKKVTVPPLSSVYENTSWKETKKELVGDKYFLEYTLNYTLKQVYDLTYYDGDEKLELSPSTYTIGKNTTLPIPQKAGYEFVGWFPSVISLTKYTEIGVGYSGDITLYARFIEVEKQNLLTLPSTPYHFETIKRNYNETTKVYTYNPVMPSGVTASVMNYDWSTSDSSIATVSAYSSISIKNGGYCVLTATLKTDPSVFINAIIKTSADGVVVSTVEEANTIKTYTVTFVSKDNEVLDVQRVAEGKYAIAPSPKTYEGLAFTGWDKDFFNVTENITVKATYANGTNDYTGKTFSFIGDSISTFQDYVPQGYATFYPYPTADVNDVNQTWWMKVCNKIGASMYINNSYSGSCVATDGSSSSSNIERLKKLVVNEKAADVIIIFMGSNDAGNNSGILESVFYSKYESMINSIYELCGEDVEIILCTLPQSKLYSDARQQSFSAEILKVAEKFNLEVVDFRNFDLKPYLIDSAHPETAGMEAMANKIVDQLVD